MNVKFRFPKPLLWGSIVLLLFVIAGCSLPMDPVDPASDPLPSKKTEESSEQSSTEQSSKEDPDDENEEQDSDDGEDEEQDSGDGQDDGPEGEGGGDEEQTPGEEQDGSEGGGGENEEQTPGEEQDGSEDEEQTPGDGQDDGPEGGGGEDEEQTPGKEQDGSEGGGGGDEEQDSGDGQDDGPENEDIQVLGNLVIRIGKMGKPEEGVYPDLGGITRYRLDFFGEDGKTAESLYLEANGELTVALDTGEWEIHAYGVMEKGTGQTPVIHGTARATVYKGGTENVLIVPDGPAAETEEQGFLSWNIDYPREKVWEAVLTVSLRIDEHNFIPYRYFDLTAPGTKEQKISLPAGTYKMESRFLSHTVSTGSTEIVHIYPGLETRSSRVTIAGNLFPDAVEFSSVTELKTYLDTRPENSEDTPYPVKIAGVDLSSKEKTGETLKTLYDVLSRYVSLDLRGCTGTELIAASANPALAGRKKIVSMILPETITTVKSNGFSGYETLKSAVLPKVTAIDYAAFNNLGSLETVAAPELTDLADSTNSDSSIKGIFYKCTALKSIYFPKLETIGHHAFYGCTTLTEVLLPKTAGVGPSVFAECTTLKTIVLPEAIFIGSRAFYNDKSLENLVLGSVPPQLEGSSHFSGGFPQKLWVPTSAIEDYQNSAVWTNMKNRIYPITE
jgi:hypothetical protein